MSLATRARYPLACYAGTCGHDLKADIFHPVPDSTYPHSTAHNWVTGRDMPIGEWRKLHDDAPRCSPACSRRPTDSGHLACCKRLKALVKAGLVHPETVRRRKEVVVPRSAGAHAGLGAK